MRDLLKRLVVEEEGQGLVEYSLIVGLVVTAIYAAVELSGTETAVSSLWTTVSSQLDNAASTGS